MTRTFKLLKPIGNIPAGVWTTIVGNTLTFVWPPTDSSYSVFVYHAENNPDTFREFEMKLDRPDRYLESIGKLHTKAHNTISKDLTHGEHIQWRHQVQLSRGDKLQ
jgi:hypothetical protein